MRRAVRIATAVALLSLVAACDKCGNVNINGPWNAKVCNDAKPRA